MGMKVLIVGSGAREDVLRREHEKSPEVDEIIAVPGNGMMELSKEKPVKRYKDVKATDISSIIEIAKKENVGLVDVGPEGPLTRSLIDELFKVGIPAFGPKLSATFIEADKAEARKFMGKYNIPQPQYEEFRDEETGLSYVRGLPLDAFPKYVKASGLCEGKGALRANNLQEAEEMVRRMKNFPNNAGNKYLIEECMTGEEVSIFGFSDRKKCKLIRKAVQDNKRVFNYDEGDQTGGMGGHAPALVAIEKDMDVFEEIAFKIVEGMLREKTPYTGILYIGGMITANGPKVVELNMRHGDPEAQVIVPGLRIKWGGIRTASYTELVYACTQGELDVFDIETDGKVRVCVVGASKGYPGNYDAVKKKRIFGIEDAMKVPGVTIYGAGVEYNDGKLYVSGGRLFSVVAEGKDVIDARAKAYEAISMIHIDGNNLHYRTDIAWRDVERLRTRG